MEKNNIEEIQNTMFLIYSKNLNFFKNDYPEIYMKISDLEKKNTEKPSRSLWLVARARHRCEFALHTRAYPAVLSANGSQWRAISDGRVLLRRCY